MSRNLATASLGLLAMGIAALCSTHQVTGQDAVLSELYGRGVHNYFAGRYFEAQESLTSAIDQGSKDPRCYYYRGLTLIRLGRTEAAKLDFEVGARLEVTGRDRIYPVGRSLQRIQGRSRLLLENYRRSARVAARTEAMSEQRARYEQQQSAEGRVLRDPNRSRPPRAEDMPPPPADADLLGQDEEPQPVAPPSDAGAEEPSPLPPLGESPQPADSVPAPAPADDPAPPALDDPFGGDPFDS